MTCCACTPASCQMPTPMLTGGSRPGTGCWATTWTPRDAADDHLRALPGMPVPAAFTGREDALAWLDAERPSLIAAVTMAASTGRDQIAMRLPLSLASTWPGGGVSTTGWLPTMVSRDAARRLGDRHDEAAALNNLGVALQEVRRFEEAITAYQDAAAISGRPATGTARAWR